MFFFHFSIWVSLLFQAQQPRKSPIYHTASDPEVKDDLDDFEPELEAIYEPLPTLRIKKQSSTTFSESDDKLCFLIHEVGRAS